MPRSSVPPIPKFEADGLFDHKPHWCYQFTGGSTSLAVTGKLSAWSFLLPDLRISSAFDLHVPTNHNFPEATSTPATMQFHEKLEILLNNQFIRYKSTIPNLAVTSSSSSIVQAQDHKGSAASVLSHSEASQSGRPLKKARTSKSPAFIPATRTQPPRGARKKVHKDSVSSAAKSLLNSEDLNRQSHATRMELSVQAHLSEPLRQFKFFKNLAPEILGRIIEFVWAMDAGPQTVVLSAKYGKVDDTCTLNKAMYSDYYLGFDVLSKMPDIGVLITSKQFRGEANRLMPFRFPVGDYGTPGVPFNRHDIISFANPGNLTRMRKRISGAIANIFGRPDPFYLSGKGAFQQIRTLLLPSSIMELWSLETQHYESRFSILVAMPNLRLLKLVLQAHNDQGPELYENKRPLETPRIVIAETDAETRNLVSNLWLTRRDQAKMSALDLKNRIALQDLLAAMDAHRVIIEPWIRQSNLAETHPDLLKGRSWKDPLPQPRAGYHMPTIVLLGFPNWLSELRVHHEVGSVRARYSREGKLFWQGRFV